MHKKYTKEELLELIKTRQISRNYLHDRYRKQYKELLITNPEINDYLKWVPKIEHEEIYESVESFQKFLDDNNIENSGQLCDRFPGVYRNYKKNRGNLFGKIKFKKPLFKWKIMTPDELQDFVNTNKIRNKHDFFKKFPKLYEHARDDWKILNLVSFPEKTTYDKWKDFNTVEDFQKFIDENEITGLKDFNLKFRGLWQRARNRNFLKDLVFPGDPVYDSFWEKELTEILSRELGDSVSIQNHVRLEECKDKFPLILDIQLSYEDKILGIEIQGPYHFKTEFNILEKYVYNRKHDFLKRRFLLNNNINLMYFSFEESLIKNYGYPFYVYTNLREFLKDVKLHLGIP